MNKIENEEEYARFLLTVRDALDVINGKWKLQIIVSLWAGNKRFRKIERSIPGMTPKVLAKELRDLQEHQLVKRTVHDDSPVSVEYSLQPYANTLRVVVEELAKWGRDHRERILAKQ